MRRVTVVWLGLVALTCITTWGLSKDLFAPSIAVVGTFLLAGLKVHYVLLDFMELRGAPTGIRVAFQVWIAAVVAVIVIFWFLTP